MASQQSPSSLCSNCNYLGTFHLQLSQSPHKEVKWNSNNSAPRCHNFGNGIRITDENEAKEKVLEM